MNHNSSYSKVICAWFSYESFSNLLIFLFKLGVNTSHLFHLLLARESQKKTIFIKLDEFLWSCLHKGNWNIARWIQGVTKPTGTTTFRAENKIRIGNFKVKSLRVVNNNVNIWTSKDIHIVQSTKYKIYICVCVCVWR